MATDDTVMRVSISSLSLVVLVICSVVAAFGFRKMSLLRRLKRKREPAASRRVPEDLCLTSLDESEATAAAIPVRVEPLPGLMLPPEIVEEADDELLQEEHKEEQQACESDIYEDINSSYVDVQFCRGLQDIEGNHLLTVAALSRPRLSANQSDAAGIPTTIDNAVEFFDFSESL